MVKRLNFIKALQLHWADAVMSTVILSRAHLDDGKETCSIRVVQKGGDRSHRVPLNPSLENLSKIHASHKQRAPKIVQTAEIKKNGTCELPYSKPSSGY